MFFRRALFLLPFFLFACDHATEPEVSLALPAIDVPWTDGQSVVCYGTSLTYGYLNWNPPVRLKSMADLVPQKPAFAAGTSRVDTVSYPYHLGARLRIPVLNQGIVGATAQEALAAVADSVLTRNPALVLLEFGANDFLRFSPAATVEPVLLRLVDTLLAHGTKVVFISFLNEEMFTTLPPDHPMAPGRPLAAEYLPMLRRVASTRGILFVEWAMRGIYWNDDLLSDLVHPNEAGYRLMADNIYASLAATFERNGMKK
jgi:acyl-CoA hydrolase